MGDLIKGFGKGAWAHFVAIGGTGMGALASMLQDLGFRVTGSDGPLYPPMSVFLDSKKIPRTESYSADNLKGAKWGFSDEHPALVIVGNAISRGQVEAEIVEKLVANNRCVRMSFAQALAEFCIRDRESFVVCGTHGKTSTATQMSWALESLGQSPGFFIGGIPANFSQGCRMGEGDCFVSEGDEYDTAYWDKESKFLHYRPTWVLCTGIEYDHADIYANVQAIEKSFHKLISKTQKAWIYIDRDSAPRGDVIERLESALVAAGRPHRAYGKSPTSAYRLLGLSEELLRPDLGIMGTVIRLVTPQWGEVTLKMSMSGEHNALNTLGILATLLEAGRLKSVEEAQRYLNTFKGVKRRQEEIFVSSELIVIDDFAHHPTAIRETIRAIRRKYPRYDVAAFFEPRSATSARNVFQKEFVECFEGAHHVYLTPPTKTNIPADQKLDVDVIRQGLEAKKISTFVNSDVKAIENAFYEDLHKDLSSEECKGRVALIMSNGSFGGLYKNMVERAQRTFKASKNLGQTTIEYILFLAMITFIITVVFFPLVKAKFEELQEKIADKTQNVIAQESLGIPLEWFELQGNDLDARFDNLIDGFDGGTDGEGLKDPNSLNSDNNRNLASGNGDLAGPDLANAGGNGDGGRASRNSRKGSFDGESDSASGVGAGGAKNQEGLGASGKTVVEARSGGGDRARNRDAGLDAKLEDSENLKNNGSEVSGLSEEGDSKSGGEIRKQAQSFSNREDEIRSKGCAEVDFSTLLKLIAILGIVVIGAIVLLSGRGGGKNSKG